MSTVLTPTEILSMIPQREPFRFIDEILEIDDEHAQAALVAHGIYLLAKETLREEVERTLSVFTDAEIEFAAMVPPGFRVLTTGRKDLEDGTLVCVGRLSGIGAPR
jgi:hypothetical protein